MTEDWPVYPDFVEGVTLHRLPVGHVPESEDCFVCGQPMPDATEGAMCWGVPGRGVAHADCYEPSVSASTREQGTP